MANNSTIRLNQAARNLNVGYTHLVEFLQKQGHEVDNTPNTRITSEQYSLLEKAFASSKADVDAAKELEIGSNQRGNEKVVIDSSDAPKEIEEPQEEDELIIRGAKTGDVSKKKEEPEFAETSHLKRGLKVVGKLELDKKGNPIKPAAKKETPPVVETPTPEVKVKETPVPPKVEEPKKEAPTPVVAAEPVQEKSAEVKAVIKPKEEAPAVKKEEVKVEAPIAKPVQEKPAPKKEEPAKKPVAKTTAPPKKQEVVAKPIVVEKDEDDEDNYDDDIPVKIKSRTIADVGDEDDEDELIKAKATKLKGLKVIGKIELPTARPKKSKGAAPIDKDKDKKRKRKRVKKQKGTPILQDERQDKTKTSTPATSAGNAAGGAKKGTAKRGKKEDASEKEVDQQLKKTLSQMSTTSRGGKSNKSRYKREKRQAAEDQRERDIMREQEEASILRLVEFISTAELATLMEVDVNEIIMASMNLGMFISINQRLDAEAITVLTDEFGFDVEFSSAEEEVDVVLEEVDKEEDLVTRAPIVTIMGHVDHGKTSLLDYVRKAKVAEGEAGGITQHIGAYDVQTSTGRRVVFLDTPGHEAFTAMRARGAKVTDVVIIVIAADDSVMPQTIEAINHAQVAGVPFVIAFNKIDKAGANVEKIKQELANMNVLVDSWGGKIQTQEISAKTGQGVDDLLELVVFESDLLTLKANPNKHATGTVIEASLDKGRGYVVTVLVQAGTLNVGDVILAGSHYGRVKAMTDHRGLRLKKVGPSTPVQVLGLNGAPQAGDKFNSLESDKEAKDIANKRGQIMREQSIRATKRTTLSDLGRRIALGNFHQLNIILKGDVDGSIEALSDSLQKLSTEEIEVNIIHKAVGPISESDVLLATASDAIVIGFQVRPAMGARKLADAEEVEIRFYSVIYDAINDVKDAMEGLLSPDIEEIIVGNVEVRDIFRISKVGTVAGCYVTEGYVKRNSQIRVIRDGIVVYGGEKGGEIQALKRYKDDVSEVKQGFECGLSIKNFNDLKIGDIVESYEERETKRTLK